MFPWPLHSSPLGSMMMNFPVYPPTSQTSVTFQTSFRASTQILLALVPSLFPCELSLDSVLEWIEHDCPNPVTLSSGIISISLSEFIGLD